VLLLVATDRSGAEQLAERIRATMGAAPIETGAGRST
jgi:hypothetical protein